ncbi:MAG: hypothetical protein ACD_7C00531G0001, partial [uncultured bacterium]
MKKTMKKTTIYISGLFLMIVFCNINIESARGDECSALGTSTEREQCKCNQKENAEEAKICLEKISNNLDEKAATYEKILLLKQKQKSLLGTQINSLNTEIVEIGRAVQQECRD